jgi:hypothetical protein
VYDVTRAIERGSKVNIYEICVQSHLDQRWSAWFENLTITYDADGNTVLRGPLADEAALHGVLVKVRDLGLPLLMVKRLPPGEEKQADHKA